MNAISDQVRGKAIRLIWSEGPSKNTVQDHVFHLDGTVEWQIAPLAAKDLKPTGGAANMPPDRSQYAGMKISNDVCLVSYLSESGYTLTVALNFNTGLAAGLVSNDINWIPVKGRFEVLKGEKKSPSGEKLIYAGETAYVSSEL